MKELMGSPLALSRENQYIEHLHSILIQMNQKRKVTNQSLQVKLFKALMILSKIWKYILFSRYEQTF